MPHTASHRAAPPAARRTRPPLIGLVGVLCAGAIAVVPSSTAPVAAPACAPAAGPGGRPADPARAAPATGCRSGAQSGRAAQPRPGTQPGNGQWRADYADVPLGSAGCGFLSGTATATVLVKDWNYWDECGASVVSVVAEGLPATPWNGDRVVKWHKPAGADHVYQKLNQAFTKDNWPSGSGNSGPIGSPADVSGRYVVYQYVPSAKFRLNPGHGWVFLSEFKEDYHDANGKWRQDPTWGLGCDNFSGAVQCSLTPHKTRSIPLADIADRWVKWEYRLYQGARDTTGRGGRIELYLDDTLMDTGYHGDLAVGSAAFSPLARTRDWVWIAGQYSSNQITNGVPDSRNTDVTSYVGLSTVLPLP